MLVCLQSYVAAAGNGIEGAVTLRVQQLVGQTGHIALLALLLFEPNKLFFEPKGPTSLSFSPPFSL